MSAVIKDHIDLLFDDLLADTGGLRLSSAPMTFLGQGPQIITTGKISLDSLREGEVSL